jgi:hypothetical protein
MSAVSAPWYELAALERAKKAGTLRTRVNVYVPLGEWQAMADTVRARGNTGDDWVRIGGVKGYVDGSLGSGTALFFDPYADDPNTFGLLVTPEDSLRRWIGAADSAGLQVVVHAIGERANDRHRKRKRERRVVERSLQRHGSQEGHGIGRENAKPSGPSRGNDAVG